MNEDILKGKWNTMKGDAKIWWGKNTGDALTQLEGSQDKLTGWFQENKGLAKEGAEDELRKFAKAKESVEHKLAEVNAQFKVKYDKLSNSDMDEVNGSFEKMADKLKDKYNHSQEEANAAVRKFMSNF